MKKLRYFLLITIIFISCSTSKTTTKQNVPEDIAKLKLGIKVATFSNDLHGIVIEKVYANYPANKAGLLKGDVIVKLEDHIILNLEHFNELIKNYKYKYGQVFVTISKKNTATQKNELKRIPLYLE